MDGPTVWAFTYVGRAILVMASAALLVGKISGVLDVLWWFIFIPALVGILQYKIVEYIYCGPPSDDQPQDPKK